MELLFSESALHTPRAYHLHHSHCIAFYDTWDRGYEVFAETRPAADVEDASALRRVEALRAESGYPAIARLINILILYCMYPL
jgi:hypothetical protein